MLIESAKHWHVEILCNDIRLFKAERAFDSKLKKLTTNIVNGSGGPETMTDKMTPYAAWKKCVLPMLLSANPQHKELRGVAPLGDLERRIQEILNQAAE